MFHICFCYTGDATLSMSHIPDAAALSTSHTPDAALNTSRCLI